MNVISFDVKRKEREQEKRYEYIDSMVEMNNSDLFDKMIAEQELTEEKIASCRQYIDFLKNLGHDPVAVFEEATFMEPMDFQADNGVCWHEAIEAMLTYYAVLRENDKDKYNIALFVHPFLCNFE